MESTNVGRGGENDEHVEAVSGIGQIESLEAVGTGLLVIAELIFLLHHLDGGGIAGGSLKGGVMGGGGIEGCGPISLEVDGVGEDQAGVGVDGVSGDEILDFAVGLIGDPGVDGRGGGVGIGIIDGLR